MRHRLTRTLCVALTSATCLALVAPLLDPRRLIAGGDVTAFHLPLRTVFRRLALAGEPYWNPLVHGGQPILSNPNYAAFYPVTWALLPFEPATALHLLLLLHLLWAAIGAWRLAAHLGCGAAAAAVATLAFTCGPLLGLAPAITIVCSWSWFPWIVRWADAALGRDGTWWRPAILAAAGLAMQLFAGDPTSVLMTGMAVAALALVRHPRGWASCAPRLAAIAALAAALAAVQLVPTLLRVGESARVGAGEGTAVWSLPPARFVEWLQPHAFGTAGYEPGYRFARGIHDRGAAYVPRLSLGLLPFVLALAAAMRWRVPRRGAWAALAAAGLFLALGRHNPLAALLQTHVPPFDLVRYPEKYVLLTAAALAFLGGLGWQHLLDRRRRGPHGDADFPAVLALVVAGLLTAGLVALLVAPERLAWLVKPLPDLEVPASYIRERLAFLRRETGVAIAVALALAGLLFCLRARRLPVRGLAVAALALLAFDLVWFGRTAVSTEPRAKLLAPPPVLDSLPPPGSRVYATIADLGGLPYLPARRGEYLSLARWRIHHLAPYSGTLFGLGYVANVDYDALATRWARWQTAVMDRLLLDRDTDRAYRFLGAWNVSAVVLPRSPRQLLRALTGSGDLRYADATRNDYLLPRYRPVSRVAFHRDVEAALDAALAEPSAFREPGHWIGRRPPDWPLRRAAIGAFEPLLLEERPSRLELRYRTPDPTAFVAATTFHPGWTATVDGKLVSTHPTAAGQIGVLLPAGRHTLSLRFFEHSVAWSGGVTLAALLLCGVLWWRR